MKHIVFLFALNISTSYTQIVSGNLGLLANQKIQLIGFKGVESYTINETQIDEQGFFQLNYTKNNYGMGYLISEDKKPLFIILSDEDTKISGDALAYTQTIRIKKGKENKWFEQYAKEQPRREQVLNAWSYLEKTYTTDSLFATQEIIKATIQLEQQRIKDESNYFLSSLPKKSYVSWYLPTRKLVSSVSEIAQYRTEEIPTTIAKFRELNYADPRLYKSGLLKEAIESHFWLLENSGRSLDSVYKEMQTSINAMMEHLIKDERILNEVTDCLFDLLERHSFFEASEYLALKVLNEINCTIDSDLAKQLESYRAMKKGATAPDILFNEYTNAPSYKSTNFPKKMSDINSKYILVVFGASWCPKCTEELPEISKHYPKWKEYHVEVVFVSLDDNRETYGNFTNNFPFISTCDFKKWESSIVNDYYVFGTPTMYLLDAEQTILLRPKSVKQLDAWIDWYLIQDNNKR